MQGLHIGHIGLIVICRICKTHAKQYAVVCKSICKSKCKKKYVRIYLGHIGHIAICGTWKICCNMSLYTKLHIGHIRTYFWACSSSQALADPFSQLEAANPSWRKSRIGAQLDPGVVAQTQEVAAGTSGGNDSRYESYDMQNMQNMTDMHNMTDMSSMI